MKTAVLGAGPGGLAIAADLAHHGRDVTLAELPAFAQRIEPLRRTGAIKVMSPWLGDSLVPIAVADSLEHAVKSADLVIISVPALAQQQFLDLVVPHLRSRTALLFMGEGGGSFAAWRTLRDADRTDVVCGETNCLPFIAKSPGLGRVSVQRKKGGVLCAALPASRTEALLELVVAVWPIIEGVESVLETALINYDAIDTVPVAFANAATVERRPGGMLLWGEGATPSVVRLIEALDRELVAIRAALRFSDLRGYRELLIAQGLAPDVGDLYEVMRAGGIMRSVRSTGNAGDLEARIALDASWSLALASSVGHAVSVSTRVIDALVTACSVLLGRDLRAEGRTLTTLGLDGLDGASLRRYTETGVLE